MAFLLLIYAFHPSNDPSIVLLSYLLIRCLALFLLFWLGSATDHRSHTPITTLFRYTLPFVHSTVCKLHCIYPPPYTPPCVHSTMCILHHVYTPPWIHSTLYTVWVEAKLRSRSGMRHEVSESEMTGETKRTSKTKRNPWRADTVARSRLDSFNRYG